MNTLLKVSNLYKSYGSNAAIKNLSFCVNEGEILGFLGPNGAGKSTTINCISTLISYDSGSITILDKDLRKDELFIKKNFGVVPQDLSLFNNLSAYKNVKFFASLYGLKGAELDKSVNEALEFVGLLDKSNDMPTTFSGGMKRRLNIACSIAHKPKLLILDEPTVGVDPQSRNHILESLKTLNNLGTTIIYTSHYMEEVESICSRIIIMDGGEILRDGSTEDLKNSVFKDRKAESLEEVFLTLTGKSLRD